MGPISIKIKHREKENTRHSIVWAKCRCDGFRGHAISHDSMTPIDIRDIRDFGQAAEGPAPAAATAGLAGCTKMYFDPSVESSLVPMF